MAVAVAAGHPQYSGTFIPEIWSGNLLVKFYSATVINAITNTDYEGEIKDVGDKVIIRQVPDITIRDYSKGQSLVIERPEAANKELLIDKAKYFNFVCDDIDKHQTDIALMDSWSTDAGEQMKITVDTGFLGDVYSDAHSSNKGATAGAKSSSYNLGASGSPVVVTKANVLDLLVDVGSVLDEQDVPESDRSIVLPPWMAGMIKKSDLKDASLAGDGTSIMRNGRLGMIDRFTLYHSNLLTSATDGAYTAWHVIACQRYAISFAAQMSKMESLRAESTFGTLVRGLNVYGYKTLKTEALCDVYVAKA
jgi:hypothetical protein